MNVKFGKLGDCDKAKLFIAWCNGRVIQFKGHHSHVWNYVTTSPSWHPDYCYRAKPEESINTIDWSLLHPCYNHLVKDPHGNWIAHNKEPYIRPLCWSPSNELFTNLNEKSFPDFHPKEVYWMDSLISRGD